MRLKRVLILLAGAGLVVVIGGVGVFGFWLLTPNNHQATFVKLDAPSFASMPCLGRGAKLISGLRVDFNVEWVTEADLVSVLNGLTRLGEWYVISSGPNVALLPAKQTVVNLWLFQVPMPRSISLAYTADYGTRLTESVSMLLCPPVW